MLLKSLRMNKNRKKLKELKKGEMKYEIEHLIKDLKDHEKVREMKNFTQHGKISTFHHCYSVACASYKLNKKLHLHADKKALMTGAMLHDFFLYDWHDKENRPKGMHGYRHAKCAAKNARKYFDVDDKVNHIISTHMWPLNLTKLPRNREAWIVCLADKYVSAKETLFMRS